MKVAITGASGLIGSAVMDSLRSDAHETIRLVRREATADDEVQWDPIGGSVDVDGLTGIDALIHLAGAGVGDRRWTASYKREIRDGRVIGTRTIARAIAGLDPQPKVMVCGSAIGYYGDTGDTEVDESSPNGDGFLAGVVRDWENSAGPARDAGIRVVYPRAGLIVAGKGGAWGRMFPLFRLGLGGRLGSGQQYWSFVSLRDEVRAIRLMIDDSSMVGPYNVTAPNAATNVDITRAMGERLHRPTFAAVPSFVLRTVLGEMSSEVLGSARVVPRRLTDAGFEFLDPTIESALDAALAPSDS
ncbi:MAG TPA: TIGR01777 family oxidoreductase [Actinomycetes bacterium]|nr:TIGR01777 family oxidoreductase [Actinomycetes bacterium]